MYLTDISQLKRGLIVSCQAVKEDPLYGSENMAKMALSAEIGGAVGLRINSTQDVISVKKVTHIPVIGIIKKHYENSLAYITPTMKEVNELVEAGADIICVDGTNYIKPDGKTTEEFIKEIKKNYNILVMTDISTVEEGIKAWNSGADIISTTLAGYEDYQKNPGKYDVNDNFREPSYDVIEELSAKVDSPIFAEGRFWTPEDVLKGLKLGAHSVVVGSAITRPHYITKRMTTYIDGYFNKAADK